MLARQWGVGLFTGKQGDDRMKLYVGNLSFSTTGSDVRALFEQAGAVSSCELVADKFTGQSRGFAFVEMESPEEGAQAVQRFNSFEFDGRRLVVNEARPREARTGGFGGGGYGGGRPSGGYGGGYSAPQGGAPPAGGYSAPSGPVPSFGGDPGGGFGGPPGGGGGGRTGGGGAPGPFAKRKSGKGSRRNARSAKRDRKACW